MPKVKIIDFGCAAELADSEPVVRQVFGNPEFSGKYNELERRILASGSKPTIQ